MRSRAHAVAPAPSRSGRLPGRQQAPADPFARELTVALLGTGPRYRSPDGSFELWHAQPQGSGERVVVAGDLAGNGGGDTVVLTGGWRRQPRYGWTFYADEARPAVAHSGAGISAWLATRLPGVGPALAEAIVDHFGADRVFAELDADPHRLAEVRTASGRRLPDPVIAEAFELWPRLVQLRQTESFLLAAGCTPRMLETLFGAYGNEIVALLEHDPYAITTLRGVGFKRADRVARALGRTLTDPGRLAAGVVWLLEQAETDGHTFLAFDQLLTYARRLLDVDDQQALTAAVQTLAAGGSVVVDQDEQAQLRVYRRSLYETERRVAQRLRGLLESPPAPLFDPGVRPGDDDAPTDEQWQAITTTARHRLVVLTGSPGTGKSHTLRSLCQLLRAQQVPFRLAAPTGKAARRAAALTGEQDACTLHRLLEFQEGGFRRTAARPLEDLRLLVVDEASMLSLELADALLAALPADTHLLLVGDADQLPPVGIGSVLSDLVRSGQLGERLVRLQTVQRQAARSLLVQSARRVNNGLLPFASLEQAQAELAVELEQDLYVVHRRNAEQVRETVLELVCGRIPRVFGFDPRSEIMTLAPMKQGDAGLDLLNPLLEGRLNAGAHPAITGQLRIGTRCVQTVNRYTPYELMNGTVCTITSFDPDRGEATLAVEDGRTLTVAVSELSTLAPAWAMTVHRAQGSEWPAVVVALAGGHPLLTRSLVYTAMTRASKLCVIVAERRALAIALKRAEGQRRSSLLAERIADASLSGELF
jgi:exodeoxyribonuclease V alpha subunit